MSAPFIGSRISLISKSDVRYEGILCGIDTNESKVYLQHVRCFGTEDRRKENPIAPATEVYEVIIFHSSDIKDLSVCELPPPVAYDPMSFNSFSHVGSGYPPQYGYPPMVHPQYGPQYGYPYGPYGHNYGMYPQSPSMMGPQDNAGAYPNAPGDQGNEKPASLSVQPPQKINVTTTKVDANAQAQSSSSSEPHPADNKETNDAQTHNADNHNNDNAKAEVTTSDESHSQKSNNFHNKNQNNNQNKRNNNRNNNFVYLPKGEAQRNNQSEKSNDNTPNNNGQQADSSSANTSNSDQQNNRQNNHNNQSDYRQKRGNSNNRGYKSHYNNNRRGFDSRGHHNSSDQSHFHKPKEQSEPKSQEDFDFLISNSKFEKLSISALPGELDKELPKISPSYNKDSFYDNISCDTLDREDQKDKKSYYEQRKLDSETFGDLGRRTSNNRGRTRGRYDTHSQNNQNNYSGNSNNQRRYNNNYNNNNRGNRNYRGNKNASGNTSNNASDNTAQN